MHLDIYDLVTAFDSLSLEETENDLYDSLEDDKLALLYSSNIRNLVSVKTPVGITKRIDIPRIVQQGGSWGPISCSNTIDTIGKECKRDKNKCYFYRQKVKILPLGMVDDIMGISKCGIDSTILNSYINTRIEVKNLCFHTKDEKGESKCHWMHVGKENKDCPCPKVHGTEMQKVEEDLYLGDIVSSGGKNKKNIENRVSKGIGAISKIFNLMDLVAFGNHKIEIGLMLRS